MDDPQLSLFGQMARKADTLEERVGILWEFLHDTVEWLNRCKYKSVGSAMVNAWEKEMNSNGFDVTITQQLEKLGTSRNSLHVLIEFPWEKERHISIWLDTHKTRFEDLKQQINKLEDIAIRRLRND